MPRKRRWWPNRFVAIANAQIRSPGVVSASLVLALALPAPALAVDLTVTGVEVTQAIQKPDNSIDLVARRSTAVRATVGVADTGGAAVPGVTGRAHVFRNGTEITPAAGVAPLASITAPIAPQRANEADTLNFELPNSALNQLTATTNLDVSVELTPVAGETNTGNNSGAANDLDVVAGVNPTLYFTRINYTPAGLGLPSDAFIQPGTGDTFVEGILPVDDRDPALYQQGLFPSLTFSRDDDGDDIIDGGAGNPNSAEGNALLNLLEQCRQLIVDNGLGATETTFLNGWLAGNPLSGNGLAGIGGRTSYANTDLNRGQRSYAHELTHNFGFDHISNNIDEVGWDVGARLDGNPAGNSTTGRVKPTTLFDIQVGGLMTNQAWIETAKYLSLLGNDALGFDADGGDQADVRKRARRRVAVIQGVLAPNGRRVLRLEPVFRYPWLSQAGADDAADRSGDFVAEGVTTTGGVIRAPFDGGIHDDSRDPRAPAGAFTATVAVQGQIALVRVRARRTRNVLGTLRGSGEAPRIAVVAPRPQAKLGPRTLVRWRISDPDTPRSRLRFQIAYSPNGGTDFVPVGVDVRGTSFAFDSRQIQRSRGRGLLRVFVSDGVNTAFADVGRLTTAAARF